MVFVSIFAKVKLDAMKVKIFVILSFISTIFCYCSPQLCLEKRTERFIAKQQKEVDTIYLYSPAFNNYNLVWYHKNGIIHGFMINPHRTEQYKLIDIKNITLDNDSFDIYFENFPITDIQCFESVLDGECIMIYIKNKKSLFCSIDTDCLFKTIFKPNSLPYKLQYDLSKLGLSPKDFNFEKMYYNK